MNKLIYLLLCVFFMSSLLSPLRAYASKEVGNGGDAVVCRNADGTIKKIELFDYYEARLMRQTDLQLSDSASTETAFALLLERMEKISKSRAKQYAEWGASFTKETRFLKGVELPDIPDSGPIPFPYGCKIEQLIIQKAPSLPGDRRYTINKDLWDALSAADRAGFIMHELIYREAVQKWGHENSVLVRYFNSVVASPAQLAEVLKSDRSLVEFLNLIHFYEAEIFGIHISTGHPYDINFDQEGHLKFAVVSYSGESLMVYGQPVLTKANGWIEFFSNGGVKSITNTGSPYLDPLTKKQFSDSIGFYDNGQIQYGKLTPGATLIEPQSGLELKESIWFDRSGRITSGELASTVVRTKHFEICGINKGGTAHFNETGLSSLEFFTFDPTCSWVETGDTRTSFDIHSSYKRPEVKGGYLIERYLLTPHDFDTWASFQNQKFKLRRDSSFEVGEGGILTHFYPNEDKGFIELNVGDRRVDFKAQDFVSSSGKTVSPDIYVRLDGQKASVECGYLAHDTELLTEAGEKLVPANQRVCFHGNGVAQVW